MIERQPPMFGQFVELASKLAAGQMHLFADVLGLARNFQRTWSIPWSIPGANEPGNGAASGQERHDVVEIERDGRVGIDLKFGSIVFRQEPDGAYAHALVDVIVAGEHKSGTRVQMELKVPAAPDSESIVAVTEKCRLQIIANLRAAADRFDGTTASALVFQDKA